MILRRLFFVSALAIAGRMAITAQEAWTERGMVPVRVPDFVAEVIERVAFEARTDKRIDRRSGVSQRMPISLLEGVVSNAERRALANGESPVVARVTDIYAALPSMTGKFELEYEGELKGADLANRDTKWPYPADENSPASSYGSSTQMWNLSLTPADVNADDFGVAIAAVRHKAKLDGVPNSTAFIDNIRVQVHYTVPEEN